MSVTTVAAAVTATIISASGATIVTAVVAGWGGCGLFSWGLRWGRVWSLSDDELHGGAEFNFRSPAFLGISPMSTPMTLPAVTPPVTWLTELPSTLRPLAMRADVASDWLMPETSGIVTIPEDMLMLIVAPDATFRQPLETRRQPGPFQREQCRRWSSRPTRGPSP